MAFSMLVKRLLVEKFYRALGCTRSAFAGQFVLSNNVAEQGRPSVFKRSLKQRPPEAGEVGDL